MSELEKLEHGLSSLGLPHSPALLLQIEQFVTLLLKWNKTYNLTAITEPNQILTRHILDSLSMYPFILPGKVLDVGSGAGFPGLPLAMVLPDHSFTLLDSNGKKTRFLTYVVSALKLTNVQVVQSRVESFTADKPFENVITRAFSSIDNIVNKVRGLVLAEGMLFIMKGTYPTEELEKIKQDVKVVQLHVPGLKAERHLVCIKGSQVE